MPQPPAKRFKDPNQHFESCAIELKKYCSKVEFKAGCQCISGVRRAFLAGFSILRNKKLRACHFETNESCDVSDLSHPQAASRRSRDWLAVIFSRMWESLTSPPSLWGFQVCNLVPRAAAATPCLGGLSNQPTNLTSCLSPIGVLGDFVSLLVAKLAHLVRV